MITKKQMYEALRALFSTSQNAKLDETAVIEWLTLFENCDLEKFEQAFRAAKMESLDFLPSPGAVMLHLKALCGVTQNSQAKRWHERENGDLILEVTSEYTDDKNKRHCETKRYADLNNDQAWEARKAHFQAGRVLCIEAHTEAGIAYSFQKWPLNYTSVLIAEGGYHTHGNEKLPFLVRL